MGANYRRLGWPSLWGLHQDTPCRLDVSHGRRFPFPLWHPDQKSLMVAALVHAVFVPRWHQTTIA